MRLTSADSAKGAGSFPLAPETTGISWFSSERVSVSSEREGVWLDRCLEDQVSRPPGQV